MEIIPINISYPAGFQTLRQKDRGAPHVRHGTLSADALVMSHKTSPSLRELEHHHAFLERHIGPNDAEIEQMLHVIGHRSLEAMTDAIVPGKIKSPAPLALPQA